MEDKLQLFYNSLTANPNIKGLPGDYELFRTTLADPGKSELFYNSLKANQNIKGMPESYDDFVTGLALNSGGITPKEPEQERPGFLEGLGKKFSASVYGAGEMATEAPQFGESVKQLGVKTLADAYINRLAKKGKITAEQAEAEKKRTDTYLPKIDWLGVPHKATTEKLPGAKMADSNANKWLSETSDRLSKEGERYDKRVVDYLAKGQFGKALGAEVYSITESLAPTLLAALGGPVGAGALGVMTGAETYDEVKDREDMQEAAKVIDGLSTGVFEALFEYLGTAEMTKMLKNAYAKGTKEQVEEALKGTVGGLLSKAYKRFGVWLAPVHEGLSEGLTTLGQNATAKFTGEDPQRKINDNFIESVLVGMGMGGLFAGTEKGLEKLANKFKGTPIDQGPAAIGELKVPYDQEQALVEINRIGRDFKFGDTLLEDDPNPVVSFALTKMGQKVILKNEGGVNGDNFFIAFDVETSKPLLVKAGDIMERKDVPYQEWVNSELQNYNIVKTQGEKMTAQSEAPVQEGQEITIKDKNFFVSQVTPEGITLNEIDEEGNITGATLQIAPDQYNTVFGLDEGIQEEANMPQNELPQATNEGIQTDQAIPEAQAAPAARTLTVNKTNYQAIPDESGILTIDQVFTDEAAAKNVLKALEKGYPKAAFSLQKTEFEDFLTPDEYKITVQPRKKPFIQQPVQQQAKPEEPQVETIPIESVINPEFESQSVGDQTNRVKSLLTNATGLKFQPNLQLAPVIGILKSDQSASERFKRYVNANPVEVATAPDGTRQIVKGQEVAYVLNQLGITGMPFKEVDYKAPEAQAVPEAPKDKKLADFPEDFQQFVNDLLITVPDLFAVKLRGLSNDQRRQAANDIKEGKISEASKRALDELQIMFRSGGITVWDKGSRTAVDITLEEIQVERNIIMAEKNGDSLDNYSYLDADELLAKGLITKKEYDEITDYIQGELERQSDDEQDLDAELPGTETGSEEESREITEGQEPERRGIVVTPEAKKEETPSKTPEETAPEEVKQKAGEMEKHSERFAPVENVLDMTGQQIVNEWEEHASPIDERVTEDEKKIAELIKQSRTTRKRDEKARINQQIQDIRKETAQLYNDLENEYFERNESIKQWGIAEAKKKGIEIDPNDENDDAFFEELMTDIFERPGREHTWLMKFKDVFDENFKYWVDNEMFSQLKEKGKAVDITKANSEVNTQPTEAQKKAGNYKKGHLSVQGFDITIENPAMSVRSGNDKSGRKWSQRLNNSYGYFRRTTGKDGDQVDVFLGDNLNSDSVYVIDQVDPETGLFDEHKVMFGLNSAQDAKDNYYANYEPGWKGLGAISKMSIDQFKEWLGDGTRTKKPVDGNVPVQKKAEQKVEPKEEPKGEIEFSERQIRENAEADERGKIWGFEKMPVNEYGWAETLITPREHVTLIEPKKGHPVMNELIAAKGPNGKWASSYSIQISDRGSSSYPGIWDEPFNTKAEALSDAAADIKEWAEGQLKRSDVTKTSIKELNNLISAADKYIINPKSLKKAEFAGEVLEQKPKVEQKKPSKPIKEVTLKPKKKGFTFGPNSRTGKVMAQTPNSFREAVLQFFIGGGRIKTQDFLDHSGYKRGSREFRQYIWAFKNDGVRLDVFNEALDNSFGIEDQGPMDMINEVIDILRTYPGRGQMITALEKLQSVDVVPDNMLPPEEDPSLEYDDLQGADEEVDKIVDDIMELPEVKEIVKQYSSDGILDVDKLLAGIEASPGEFTIFPFALKKSELLKLKERLQDEQRRRTQESQTRTDQYNQDQGQSTGENTPRSDQGNTVRAGREETTGPAGTPEVTPPNPKKEKPEFAGDVIDKKPAENLRAEAEKLIGEDVVKKLISEGFGFKRGGLHTPELSFEDIGLIDNISRTALYKLKEKNINPVRVLVKKGQEARKPEPKSPAQPVKKGPDLKTTEGQISNLKYYVEEDLEAQKITNRIIELRKITDKTPAQTKELREKGYAYETVYARAEELRKNIDNTIIPEEKIAEITKLIKETIAKNQAVGDRILNLQSKRDSKEKELQKRNELLGDRNAEAQKQAGEQSLFAGDALFAPNSENLQSALKPFNDAIKKAEEEWKRNDQLLDEQIDLVLKGTQQKITYEEPKAQKEQPGKQSLPPDFGKTNKVVTESAKDAALRRIKERRNNLKSGIDPADMLDSVVVATYYVEGGMRKFADIAKKLIEDIGEWVRPYTKVIYNYVRDTPDMARYEPEMDSYEVVKGFDVDKIITESFDNTNDISNLDKKSEDVSNRTGDSQPNSQDNSDEVSGDEGTVPDEGGISGPVGDESSQQDRERSGRGSSQGGSGLFAPLFGEPSDNEVPQKYQSPELTDDDAGDFDGRGNDLFGPEGYNDSFPDTGENDSEIDERLSASFQEKTRLRKIAQQKAESVPVKIANRDNIAASLPVLLPEQQDDVLKAENRFFSEAHQTNELAYGKGMLFTNGTGTGKTYTGLGIIKRFVKLGKSDILIVVPSEAKKKDWIKDGENLLLSITELKNTKDKGKGVRITTYATFRANDNLKNVDFDLIVYDECHRLMEDKGGNASATTETHYQMANVSPSSAFTRLTSVHPLWIRQRALRQRIRSESKSTNNLDLMDWQLAEIRERIKQLEAELEKVEEEMKEVEPSLQERANKAYKTTKVVMLSATPFKGHFNLRFANKVLFDWGDETTYQQASRGMSRVDPEGRFFLNNFGAAYEWKNHHLQSKSKANAEAIAMQEVEFAEKLMRQGVLSGRAIESDMDYSREFPLVALDKAEIFNQGFTDIFTYGEAALFPNLAGPASEVFFNYNYTTQLLESLRASMSIPRIEKHLALGRKVVVFHRRKQANATPPFANILQLARGNAHYILKSDTYREQEKEKARETLIQADIFETKYKELLDYEQTLNYSSAIDQIVQKFGANKVALVNGDISKKDKVDNIRRFNEDDSGLDIIVVQEEAGKEGISLHDTTGNHPRVMMSLSLPISSTTALQMEGRIFRIGQESNAIFENPILGLDMEIADFGQKINRKLSTTENLAVGNQARDLIRSFSEGVLFNSKKDDPHIDQGKGGKEYDKKAQQQLSEFRRAVLVYNTNQKNRGRRDSREGIDYFATPEPLGQKMVDWLGLKPGNSAMEPSAGHGAIAMWFPESINTTSIEPSYALYAKLNARAGGGNRKIVRSNFEDFNIINKFDGIAMNPPFGAGGKMAMDHVEKAFKHLKNGGRIVAIIPDGPSMQKRFDNFINGTNEDGKSLNPDAHIVESIKLPRVTFEQAGTQVSARVVIIDKIEIKTKTQIQSELAAEDLQRLLSQRGAVLRPREVIAAEALRRYEEQFEQVPQAIEREIPEVKTVDEFFDRLEDISVPDRPEASGSTNSASTDSSIAPEPAQEGDVAKLIIQKHSKTGQELPTVQLLNRVSSDVYSRYKYIAHSFGGKWSSYAKEGMVPGFMFRNVEDANKAITQLNNLKEGPDAKFRISEDLYFSPVERALGAIKQEKATPQQWKAMLLKNGAKETELAWMGWDEFASMKNKKLTFEHNTDDRGHDYFKVKSTDGEVERSFASQEEADSFSKQFSSTTTRADIQTWINQNKVEIKEVGYGGEETDDRYDKLLRDLERVQRPILLFEAIYGDYPYYNITSDKWVYKDNKGNVKDVPETSMPDVLKWNEAKLAVDEYIDEHTDIYGDFQVAGAPKYSQYTMPGGEDYKELLLTLPDKTVEGIDIPVWKKNRQGLWAYFVRDKQVSGAFVQNTLEQQEIAYQTISKNTVENLKGNFHSGHWDEPNILAHVRFNTRRSPDGKNILFIEEIQSDWAQEGKRKGFKSDIAKSLIDPKKGEVVQTDWGFKLMLNGVQLSDITNYEITDSMNIGTDEEIKNELIRKASGYNALTIQGGLPDMPYKKTDQWAGLALRRMVRYAIDNGFDAIAWTPGEVQAERYDLSKQIRAISYNSTREGKYNISVYKNENEDPIIVRNYQTPEELEPVIGKELTQKIVNGESTREVGNVKMIEGLDLKVGGSGMTGFYDNILPSIANKLGKKFGSQVGKANIETVDNKYSTTTDSNKFTTRQEEDGTWTAMWKETGTALSGQYKTEEEAQGAIDRFVQTKQLAVHTLPITEAMFDSYRQGIPLFKSSRSLTGESLLLDVVSASPRETWETEVRDKVNILADSLNTKIEVINNRSQLPGRIQRQALRQGITSNKHISGVYDPQTDTVYVILDEIRTAGTLRAIEEVTKTVLHEVVAHQGLPSVLGEEEYNKLLDDLFWSIPQLDRSFLMEQYNTSNPRTISEEYLGMMAEQDVNPTLFQRMLAKIRQLIRKLFKVNYTENDIHYMLRRSRENLQKPKVSDFNTAEGYLEAVDKRKNAKFRIAKAYKDNIVSQAAEVYKEKEARRTIEETKQGIREYIQDLNLPIRKFEEEVLKRGGKQDNESKPYRDTSLSFGRQEKLYNDFFDQKMKPVLAAVANIKKSGVSGEEVLPYIICKHAIERNRAFREKELNDFIESHPDAGPDKINDFQEKIKNKDYSGVMAFDREGKYTNPDELAKDIASEFESQVDKKLINDLWAKLREANSEILDTWEAGQQISPEQKQEYLAKFKHFVPLRGWREGAAKELRYTKGQGFSHSLRHAEGRKSLADNPLAYILNVEFQAIAEQVTNEVNSSMLNLIIRNLNNNEIHELATLKKLYYLKVNLPDGSYEWEPTLTRPTPEQFANGEATTKIYREHERLRAPSQAQEHEVIVHKPGGDMVMIFKGKNLSVAQALNKQNYLYRTIFGNVHDARDINKAMAFLGNLNNMLKAAYTSWNVVFPFTNFMRDFQEASITQAIKQGNGLKVIRNYKHTFPAIIRQMTGRQNLNNSIDRSLDEFYKTGGATGYTHLKTPEEIEKDINKEIKRMVRAGTLRGDMANTAHKFLLGIENWNRIFEDATRFSVYMASLSAGNTKEDAASDAKEASVNFNRKGKGSKAWDAYFAFFNVALQSMQKNFGLAKNHTGKFSAVALSFVTVGFLEAMMNALFDDDDDTSYYNINPYMRQNYLLIPNIPALIKGESKGDKYLSIPLPQFWRGFKSMGAIGFDIATKRMNVKDGVIHALGNFGSSLLPVDIGGLWKSGELSLAPIMPTVIKPITEVLENRNYMGYAIKNEPFTKDQKKVLARAGLGKKNVSPAAKFITDMLFRWGGGDSKYKYYYDSYQGRSRKVPGILDINPSTIEHLFKGYTGGTGAVFSDMITTISQGLSSEQEIDYRNAPFINRFVRKIPEAKWNVISDYYSLRDDSKIINSLSANYFKEGRYEKTMEILGDEYLMKYTEIFKHYESSLDEAKKDTDFDNVEGSYRGIELMRQCINDIKDLKEEYGR